MEESESEVQLGDLVMYRARPALVTAIRPNPKTATPHARLAFLDGTSSEEYSCWLLPPRCWQPLTASQLTPAQQQHLDLLSGTLPEGALLPGIPQFLLDTLEQGGPLDLHLHVATTAELASQVSALLAEMLCRRRINSILVLCQQHRIPLWQRALATYFDQRFLCLSNTPADQATAAYPFLLAAYPHMLQPHRLAELPSDHQRFLVLDQPHPEFANTIPASHQLTLGLLRSQPQPYTPLRQIPTPSPLYYLPSSGEVQVTRAFNLFCWAFTELLAQESPANHKHGETLMTALAEQLQTSPAVFKQSWLHLRQGLAENQWAGSAEVEAAWQVVQRMKHWDDREHRRATLAVFKRLGAWLLPMAEPIQHELNSLDEALCHWSAQQDGRVIALRRIIESQKESAGTLMVVTRFADVTQELAQLQWPVAPQLQPPELTDTGFSWFLCTDSQLADFEDVTPDQLIHWDLPEDLATLIYRRKSDAPEFFLQNSKKPTEGHAALFKALTAAVWPDQTFYRLQLHKSLMELDTVHDTAPDFVPPQAHGDSTPSAGLAEYRRACDWFLKVTPPKVVPLEPERLDEGGHLFDSEPLREVLGLFAHLGRSQMPRLLECFPAMLHFETSVPAERWRHRLFDGSELCPTIIWHGAAQLPVFFANTPEPMPSPERVRAWLRKAKQALALVTCGFQWQLIPLTTTPATLRWESLHFFRDGADSPQLYAFLQLIEQYVNHNQFPWENIYPCQTPASLLAEQKLVRQACAALLQAADASLFPLVEEQRKGLPQLVHALFRFLLQVSGHADTWPDSPDHTPDHPQDPHQDPQLLRYETALAQAASGFNHAAWQSFCQPLEKLRKTASDYFALFFAALGNVCLARTTEDTFFPKGHKGPGIPLSLLEQVPELQRPRFLARWQKAENLPPTFCWHPSETVPQLSGWWQPTLVDKGYTLPAGHWYLTWDDEQASKRPVIQEDTLTANLRETLEPLLYETDQQPKTPEQILGVTVCNLMLGSGNFLVCSLNIFCEALQASLHHHGRFVVVKKKPAITLFKKNIVLPSPQSAESLEQLLREQVVRHCLFAVDSSPLAIDLTRLQLRRLLGSSAWADHLHLGNPLIGCWPHHSEHYPLAAWEREAGDEQHEHFVNHFHETYGSRTQGTQGKQKRGDRWAAALRQKRSLVKQQLQTWLDTSDEQHRFAFSPFPTDTQKTAGTDKDRWCAIWFWPHSQLELCPTPLPTEQSVVQVQTITAQLKEYWGFFHWAEVFPKIFGKGGKGFSVVLGAPASLPARPSPAAFFGQFDPLFRYRETEDAAATTQQLFAQAPIEEEWLEMLANHRALNNWLSLATDPFGDGTNKEPVKLERHAARDEFLRQQWQLRRDYARAAQTPFRVSGAAQWADRPYIEMGLHLLSQQGRLLMLTANGLFDRSQATPLRRYLLEHCGWERLVHSQDQQSHAILQVNKQKADRPLLAARQQPGYHLLAGQVEGTELAATTLAGINPESLAIPGGDAMVITILQKLHRHSITPGQEGLGISLFSFAKNARELRHLQKEGYVETQHGFWIKGNWRVRLEQEPHERWLFSMDQSQVLLLEEVEHIGFVPALEPDQLQLALRLPGAESRQSLSFTPTNSTTQHSLTVPLSALACLGCMTSITTALLLHTKWGKEPRLERLSELPLANPASLPVGFQRACARLFVDQPRFAKQHDELHRLSGLTWHDPHATPFQDLCRIDAYLAFEAGLCQEEVQQHLQHYAGGRGQQLAASLAWLEENGADTFFHPREGWQLPEQVAAEHPLSQPTEAEYQLCRSQVEQLCAIAAAQVEPLATESQNILPF